MAMPEITEFDENCVVLHEKDPQIVLIKKFISEDERLRLIDHVETLPMETATTITKGVVGVTHHRVATTYSDWNGKWGTEDLINIDKRLMTLTNWKSNRTENWTYIKYGPGGKYVPHFDYFQPEDLVDHHRQRNGTMVLYLKTAEEGGYTCFPYLRLSVKDVEPGDAIFFNYEPLVTKESFHGGTTVIKGEKLIVTRWFNQLSIDEIIVQRLSEQKKAPAQT